jgi:hypothetical protein
MLYNSGYRFPANQAIATDYSNDFVFQKKSHTFLKFI